MKKKLLAVFAHPDDESFACGGTLAKYAAKGVEIDLLCATRGEAGQWSGVSPKGQTLGQVRERELLKAAGILGVKKVEFLDFVDGTINNQQVFHLEKVIARRIRKIRPQVVICFDVSGISGHLDHIAVSLATTRAFFQVLPPKKLYWVVYPKSLAQKYQRPFLGFPDELITTRIKVGRYWARKIEGLKAHLTQEVDWRRFLRRKNHPKVENFYLAGARVKNLKFPEDDLFWGI